jgi:hypothetical protein
VATLPTCSKPESLLGANIVRAGDAMLKKFIIALVGVVLVVAILTAGCRSNTSTSSSPSQSATQSQTAQQSSGINMTSQVASYVQSQGYTLTMDVDRNPSGSDANSYGGTATDSNGTYWGFVAQAYNSQTETSNAYNSAVSDYTSKTSGYTVVTADDMKTTLKNQQNKTVVISQDTLDNIVFVFIKEG